MKKLYEKKNDIASDILALRSENQKRVVKGVDMLIQKGTESSQIEKQLIEIVRDREHDETFAPLWSMIVLGHMHSRNAVPLLLAALDSENDFWHEAASEALTQIAQMHGETILDSLEQFIEVRLEHDPFHARLFAYEPISSLLPHERAAHFLIRMFEEDAKWRDLIAHDLITLKDKRLLHLFRRALEFAIRSENKESQIELRDAYCLLDGALSQDRERKELWELPWKERWQYPLDLLGKNEEEIEKYQKGHLAFSKLSSEDFLKYVAKENEIRDHYPLCDFDIKIYLTIRQRSVVEEDFNAALQLLGFDKEWNVEKVQEMISAAKKLNDVIKQLTGDHYAFSSECSLNEFLNRLTVLWNHTPREEFQGLTPAELSDIPELREQHRQHNASMEMLRTQLFNDNEEPASLTEIKTKPRIGRNDYCPCGAVNPITNRVYKYKKCGLINATYHKK